MKNVLTVAQVRAAEQTAMSSGVSETFLRFNASLAVADFLVGKIKAENAKTAVFCGTGGNGCDGLMAACRLYRQGCDVTAYVVGDRERMDKTTLAFAVNDGMPVRAASEYTGDADVIVDAIFGIGLNRAVEGEAAELIKKLNAQKNAFRLAVDIPSGLNADTGEIMGVCFCADVTLTFSCYKIGMLFLGGKDGCGKVLVKEIGVKTPSDIRVYEDEDFPKYKRSKGAHKGTSGKIYIIGGSGSMVGAPMMAAAAAHAAYLNGAGTVTACVPSIHRSAMSSRATMAMMKYLPDTPDGFIRFDKKSLDEIISSAAAIDMGVGMGANPELKRIVEYLCANFDKTIVIDADALNAIKLDYAFLKNAKAKVVLTPHVGEFNRLTGKPATVENATSLAKELGCIVVLKSATTIITDGKEVRLNVSGTPAMAKGGMGDVLGGCITALSCAFMPLTAACIACYRNGMGAERAVSSYAEMMLTADDVLRFADYKE